MCDYFWQRMEKGQGDLTDIFQGSGLAGPVSTSADIPTITTDTSWQPHLDPAATIPSSTDGFQENFTGIKDPMLHELVGTGFFGYTEKLAESMAIAVVKQPPLAGLTDAGKIGGGVAIPVPRTQGIKRRKNQARKVVCIPAPAAASNKPGGEVVPSDLWAWRKYGQKPIKGSPYPRGYYRCSSSKGCSARKQVERSRTDPNMLVITYTSDHNHPWPTQRNALAGSTRSQCNSKNNNNASSSKTSSTDQKLVPVENVSTREEEEEEEQEVEEEEEAQGSPISSSLPLVKESENNTLPEHFHHDFNQGIHKSFNELEPDDFFADLAVLEASTMSLDGEKSNNKAMDPFNMFGWDGGNSS
ncbi:probable WRKY transcription factor 14 [Phalaenopsis equestris]|uniref:probable WRKY transcription factor 14 n=1 Tax=Phalaenopsis equestris TaxID=78828 RepID=UPI0009E51E32|nr:probable WRKY transcription factor 14 [Phalaenopsis equestris]